MRVLLSAVMLMMASTTQIVGAQPAPQEYMIKLSRPNPAGQVVGIQVKGHINRMQTMEVNGAAVKSDQEDIVTELKGKETIKELDAGTSVPLVVEVAVESLKYQRGGMEAELCKPGSVIKAVSSGEKIDFSINGTPANALEEEILTNVISLAPKGEPGNDEIFGTARPVKVGQIWPPKVAQMGAALGLKFAPRNAYGKVKLASIETKDGEPCETIEMEMTFNNFQGPLPPGVTADRSMMKLEAKVLLPVRLDAQPKWESQKMTMWIHTTNQINQNGAIATMNTTQSVVTSSETTYTSAGTQKP